MISQWLGLRPYREVLQLQLEAAEKAASRPIVLGCEHPPIITLGQRARAENEVKAFQNLEVISTDRGGQATIHSPGQLVIYPILPLRMWRMGVREFIETCLNTTAELLHNHGLASFQKDQAPGLFTSAGKIAFIGVRIERGVSRHGLAINIHNDLNLFHLIRACGQENEQLAQFATHINLPDLFATWFHLFERRLKLHLESKPACDPEEHARE